MTEAEKRLWKCLRLRRINGFKFRRQAPIGPFIVDFVSFEGKLIIEADGSQHIDQREADAKRTAWLKRQGFEVLRYWDSEVLRETEAVEQAIYDRLAPRLNPPPRGGRKSNGDLAESGAASVCNNA